MKEQLEQKIKFYQDKHAEAVKQQRIWSELRTKYEGAIEAFQLLLAEELEPKPDTPPEDETKP